MDARSPSFSCSGERRSGAAWSAVIGRRLLPGPRPWGVCVDGCARSLHLHAGPAPVGRLHYGIERPSLPTRRARARGVCLDAADDGLGRSRARWSGAAQD